MRALRLFVALVLAADPARAADDPNDLHVRPCRPTISCSADLVPPGAVEIELGYAPRSVRPGGWTHTEPVLLKLTLTRWLQAQVGGSGYVFTQGQVAKSLRYYDDVSFGFKTHVVDQTSVIPSVSASAALSVPSFQPPVEFPHAYDLGFWVYASKDIGKVHLDLNGGANLWQFDHPDRSVQPFAALASSFSIVGPVGAMAETYVFASAGRIAPKDAGLLTALSYAPGPRVLFDAGVDTSFVQSTRLFTLFVGVTFVPVRLWGGENRSVEGAVRAAVHTMKAMR